jgi:hypothetical protein
LECWDFDFAVLNLDVEVLNFSFAVLNSDFEVLNLSFAVGRLRHQGSERQL